MQAAVVDRYGGPEVVRVAEVGRPAPKAGQVLVRVRSAAVTSGDARIRGARFPKGFASFARLAFGVLRPRRKILGGCCSGEVVALGAGVDGFAVGDEVCGMTGGRLGTHAEFVTVPRGRLASKPATVGHDEAAGLLFGGSTALHFLRAKAGVGPGMSVLVNGASGAIGTNAVQLAKHFGATVTAVTSGPNADLVRSLGADDIIDHTLIDLASTAARFDVVFDTVGNLSIASGKRLLNPGGTLLLAVADLGEMVRARGQVVAGAAPERAADFEELLGLVADGTLRVVVEAVGGLDAIVDAHRRVDTGHKVGNLVIHP